MLRKIHRLHLHHLLPLALFVAMTSFGLAQSSNGASVSGIVQDSQDARIANANVKLVNNQNGTVSVSKTNNDGNFVLPGVLPGSYTLEIERDAFTPTQLNGIVLHVGDAKNLIIHMKVGSARQEVTVNSGTDLINSTTAEISQVIDENSIKELPLNGRDPSSLVALSAGVTNELLSQASDLPTRNSFPTESGASAGGGRQGSTWYLLDGASNMDTYALLAAPFPNADATQEFRVISNNFDARYGFAPGAVVNIQTKPGTNEFHGGIFEFLRNSSLNAGNYFTHAVDPLRRNQFGGYLGSPIIKNKLFVFGNYQGTRAALTSSSNVTYTPTAAMLNGDFSAIPSALHGPFTTVNGKPNQVNTALYSLGALQIAKSLPSGGVASTGLTNYVNPAETYTYDEGTGRLDYTINDRQRVFLRNFTYNYSQPGVNIPGNILAGVRGQHGIYLSDVIGHTWVISPSLLNSVTVSYLSLDYGAGTLAVDSSGHPVCLSNYIAVSDPAGSCYIGGLSALNGNSEYGGGSGFSAFAGAPRDTKRRDWGLSDTVTKVLGNQSLSFGGDLLHRYHHESSGTGVNPVVSFNGQYTGSALADFLLGYVQSFSQGAGESGSTHGWMVGLYAQDQYKVRTNLTVTAGLRWDPNFPLAVVSGRGAAFIPGQQSSRYPSAPVGLVFPGDKGIGNGLMPTTFGYFEPRIGVAYSPRENLVVRAAFGLFTTPLEDAFYNSVWDAAPFSPSYSLAGTTTTPISFDHPWSGFAQTGGVSPFPPFSSPTFIPPSSVKFITPIKLGAVFAPNFKLGITQSWNLSIEQQLTKAIALHLAYVGSESYHMATTVEQNPGIYAANGQRTLYPQFSSVIQVQDGATGSYQSLQAGIEKRLLHGLQIQSNFTWSRTMDVGGSGDPTFESSVSDPFDIGHDKGRSSLNFPIVSVTNFIYSTPLLDHHNVIVKNVFGGWALSGLWTMQSGPPFTINGGDGNNRSGFNVGQDRADVTGRPFQVRSGGKANWLNSYFNPAAFTNNAVGTPGNSEKFLIQEAPLNTMDLGISKSWRYAERYRLQFRWEMFNALNHPSFGQPDSNPGDANFGQITSVGVIAPRVMQGALKLTF